jgi:CRP-like cAMP-binding protein
MTRNQSRLYAKASGGRGTTMQTLADRKGYATFLEGIPAFSSCSRNDLEEFATHEVVKVHCAAGKSLSPQVHRDQNFYVLVAGSALLDAGDDVVTLLEPGDFFGSNPARPHHLVASVVAVSDVEVLVIDPQDLARLTMASSRRRHPSKIDWYVNLSTTTRRTSRRSHRRAVLVHHGE